MSFAYFGLSEQILKALKEKEYTRATPIQIKTIPLVSQG
jgi:superfamily II DNA/RNA helicase